MTIRVEEGRPVFRLKHFGADLVGWEAADEALTYPLARVEDGEVVFENPQRDQPRRFVYRRVGDDGLTVRLEGPSDGKNAKADEFTFRRVIRP